MICLIIHGAARFFGLLNIPFAKTVRHDDAGKGERVCLLPIAGRQVLGGNQIAAQLQGRGVLRIAKASVGFLPRLHTQFLVLLPGTYTPEKQERKESRDADSEYKPRNAVALDGEGCKQGGENGKKHPIVTAGQKVMPHGKGFVWTQCGFAAEEVNITLAAFGAGFKRDVKVGRVWCPDYLLAVWAVVQDGHEIILLEQMNRRG